MYVRLPLLLSYRPILFLSVDDSWPFIIIIIFIDVYTQHSSEIDLSIARHPVSFL